MTDIKKNMETWDALRTVPAEMLKTIGAGRLKGKSDINPQWRIQRMTEVFGPCGEGWRYTIDRLWTEHGHGGEVCAFALVSVIVGQNAPIQGVGGSMLIAQERDGMHTSDEAFKMAVTDALSVALKAFGMAADIYLGKWDGSKYKDEADAPRRTPTTPAAKPETGATTDPAPRVPAGDEGDHWCSIHQCRFFKNEKDGRTWYSHKIKDGPEAGKYCKEPQAPEAPRPAPAPAAPAAPAKKPDAYDPNTPPDDNNW